MTDTKKLCSEVDSAFRESLLQTLKIEEVRKMVTVPIPSESGFQSHISFQVWESPNVVILEEYADYLDISQENAIERARLLGAGCGILYNALIRNARSTHGHKVVTDLLENDNLKVNVVFNSQPSVADPAGLIPGWIAFRFRFASSSYFAPSLRTGSTLSALEGR